MHRITLFLVLLFFQNEITAQVQKQVLLLGAFHFENPGADLVKVNSVDVLSDQNQKEIALITESIKDFKPDKIFVEHPYNRQSVLDSLYQNYLNGNNRNDRDEIIQIAFRAAEKLGMEKVYAIDYLDQDTDLPFDSLMNEIQKSGQEELLASTIEKINQFQDDFNEKVQNGEGVLDLLLYRNDSTERRRNIGFYVGEILEAGSPDNFVAAYLASQWYRRNLYMYSLIRKLTEPEDNKIFVILGSGHVAMIQQFIAYDNEFKIVELKEIVDNKK